MNYSIKKINDTQNGQPTYRVYLGRKKVATYFDMEQAQTYIVKAQA